MNKPPLTPSTADTDSPADLRMIADAMDRLSNSVVEAKGQIAFSDRSPEGLSRRLNIAEHQLVLGEQEHQKLIALFKESEESLRVSQDALQALTRRFEEQEAKHRASDIVLNALATLNANSKESLRQSQAALHSLSIKHEAEDEKPQTTETVFEALKKLYAHSKENLDVSQSALESLLQQPDGNEENQHLSNIALDALNKVIVVNKETFRCSFLALEAVSKLAFYDALTDLPNRRLLSDRLTQAQVATRRAGCCGAVMFIDLDKFKLLNDRYGHIAGDQLLVAIADRLKLHVRESDTVARYGGDEFVVVLSGLDADRSIACQQMHEMAEKLRLVLSAPYSLTIHHDGVDDEFIDYQCLASFGVAMFDGTQATHNNLLDWADEAMYQAKQEGGNRVHFYDPIRSSQVTLAHLYGLATAYDIETANHGKRLQQYLQALVWRLQTLDLFSDELSEDAIELMIMATPLHDIGKTKVPIAIVHKPGQLTPAEWEVMKTHTTSSEEILNAARKQNKNLDELLDVAIVIAGGHHERWDGNGYPRALKGETIPLAARLVAVVDVYDALVTARVYKKPWTHEQAIREIQGKMGTQFDPRFLDAFMLEANHFQATATRYADSDGFRPN